MTSADPPTGKNAYVTLLTRPSYLAGALLLAYTLHKHSPTTPLIICYTPDTLSEPSIRAFKAEARHSNILLHPVSHLRLPDDGTEHGMVAERFIDTWTKLRVFDLHVLPQRFERLCWLDADMMVFSDPSPFVFNQENDAFLQGGDGMRTMAVHTCVCNLDGDSWAPKEWRVENCALSHLESPEQVPEVRGEPSTFGNFNSGTFLYRPSEELSAFVKRRFEEIGNKRLRAMKFPDQDFLNEAFENRWKSLSWRTNALKTWRYWHPNIWRDEKVAVLHYIVDKPWAARVKEDGTAGYLGKDGETHKWWWDEFENWRSERKGQGEGELLETVGRYVASEKGEESEEMKAIGGGAQDFAKKWVKEEEAQSTKEGKQKNEEGKSSGLTLTKDAQAKANAYAEKMQDDNGEYGDGPNGPILRKPMLGERGHGPVVRGRGGAGAGAWGVMRD